MDFSYTETTTYPEDETLTHAQAAALLKCSVETLAGVLATGQLPSIKFGRERVIPRSAFLQRLNELAIEESSRLRRSKSTGIRRRRALPEIA